MFFWGHYNNQRLRILKSENDKVLFNMESFNNIIKYLVEMEDNLTKISHDPHILALDPINIIDYQGLNTFEYEQTIKK